MRVSELIEQLQDVLEFTHSDPDVMIETDMKYNKFHQRYVPDFEPSVGVDIHRGRLNCVVIRKT